jgi:CO/xanthine dehydrogenase Mo-binding subunit
MTWCFENADPSPEPPSHGRGQHRRTCSRRRQAQRWRSQGNTFAGDATEAQKQCGRPQLRADEAARSPVVAPAHSWSAQFVEVRVDEDFGTVRVKRMVAAFDSGLVFNPKLARSQWIGGMVMGIGQSAA